MGRCGVRLSQCMIVKDEEKNIEKALTWGKDVVYEQIVVDTGSTDRTVEIAKKLGAKVYHFQWIDDFAAAKNYAIGKARGDWIAFLDADEYFSLEDAKKLPPLLEELSLTSCYAVQTSMLHLNGKGRVFAGGIHIRVFKRIPGLIYHSPIHEILLFYGEDLQPYTYDASQELTIFHTGYWRNEETDEEKGNRNAELIRKELEKNPDDYTMMGYLGDACYLNDQCYEEAEKWYRKAIEKMPDVLDEYDSRSATTFWKLLSILSDKKDDEAMMEVHEKAVRKLPKDADFDFIVGRHFARYKDYEKGAIYLEQALHKLEEYGMVNRGILISGKMPETWELLALCHYKNGNLGRCVERCVNLLSSDPYVKSVLTLLLFAFDRADMDAQQMLELLKKFYHLEERKDRVYVLYIATHMGCSRLIQAIRDLCTPEELEAFDRTLEKQETAEGSCI